MVATIVVTRSSAPWRDRSRAYKLIVDSYVTSDIRDGQEVQHTVHPGTHTLALKIDWKGSDTVTVNLGAGETARFVCEPAAGSVMALKDLFSRRPWIALRRIPPSLSVSG